MLKKSWSGCSYTFSRCSGILGSIIYGVAGDADRDNKMICIIPRHLQLSIRNVEEMNKLLSGVTTAQGGVLPNI
jgi:histone H2A